MAYEFAGGSLKLKGLLDKEIKKKKKKSKKDKDKTAAAVAASVKAEFNQSLEQDGNSSDSSSAKNVVISATKDAIIIQKPSKTKAELAYARALEKRNEEKIFKKAEKSHKEHVEDFNRHLDSLTEYHDVPKVSWTK